MSTDGSTSPLAAVTVALERGVELGELTPAELEWALARLAGRRRGQPHAPNGRDRREVVLRAATEVFLRSGYHNATLEDVAARVPLTKAGVYYYFGSKQEILDAICERAMTAFEQLVREGLDGPSRAEERLRRTAARYLDAFLGDASLAVFMRHFDDLSDGVRAALRARRKRIEAQLRRTLEEGVGEGAFEVPDAQVAVLVLFGAVNWTYSWYRPGGRLTEAEVRDALVRHLLNGIRAA